MSEASVDAQLTTVLDSLRRDGHIDEQFDQLLALQDESDPDFVRSLMELFFQDSERAIQKVRDMLVQPQVDFVAIDQVIHQLKGSSASFGAHAVTGLCLQLRQAVQAGDASTSRLLLQQVADARHALQQRMEVFARLQTQQQQQDLQQEL